VPNGPLQRCATPGCPSLVTRGHCAAHESLRRLEGNRFARPVNGGAMLYGRSWRQASRLYLATHPFCVVCLAAGRRVLSTVTDHVIPHRGDRYRFWDRGNWQPLCAVCHARKTAREVGWRPATGGARE
jgi:5-methylcytosine-specific restriction enzyme A